jgi:hypothetical protein
VVVDGCERLVPLVSVPMLGTASAAVVVVQVLFEDNGVAIVNAVRLFPPLYDTTVGGTCSSGAVFGTGLAMVLTTSAMAAA